MPDFSLLTLNCYGVPSMRTYTRLSHLAQILNNTDYSIVCLQEVQSHRYRYLFRHLCTKHYPSQAYEPFIHAPKGGLLTLSRMSVKHKEFMLFKERGLWYTPALMDWILHKGVLLTRTIIDDLLVITLNTHLTANYTGNWSKGKPFAMQEYRELMQVAELINVQPADALVIVAGDFNVPRGSWMYWELLNAAHLVDPMAGDTRPTFRPHPGMPDRYAAPIDFTLYRAPDSLKIKTTSDLQFQDKALIAGTPQYLSDHFAIETHFTW
jgi:endonuclease/exonuclease/phosphatase family metal-dependent hydrolase